MATRKDVADLAGVSPAVVSYVLNKSNYVSEEKRAAVLKAVEKLNYQPNYMGRSLKNKKTNNLGLICDDIRSELFAEIAFYSERYAYENGYSLFLCTSHQDDKFLNGIVDHRLDGIFLATSIYSTEQINQIAKSNIPVALYKARHYDNLDPRVKCIEVDYRKAAYMLTERLILKGHERIAFFPPYRSKLSYWESADFRFKGYQDAMRHYGRPVDETLICYDNEYYEDIMKKAEEICRRSLKEEGRIAFVTGNDYLAIRIMTYLKEVKLYHPETVSITGMDNTSSAGIASPSLTTAGFSKVDVAKAVVDYLINGADEGGIKTKKIPVFLVEGNSG